MSSTLEPLAQPGRTLADVAAAVALGDVILDVVKARKSDLVDDLTGLAHDAAQVTGSDGLTSRIDGVGQVILTAPQPKVSVADSQAFGAWLADCEAEPLGLVAARRKVEVTDPATAGEVVAAYLRGEDVDVPDVQRLMDCLRLTVEYLPAEDAVDRLVDKGWAVVRDTAVHELDPDTGTVGGPIPGLTVRTSKQSCYVRADKRAKQRVAGEVRTALGLGGGA